MLLSLFLFLRSQIKSIPMKMGIPFTITWSFSFHEDGDTIDQREPSPSLSPYEQYVKGNRREVKEFLAEVMVKAPIYSLTSRYLQKLFSQMVKLYILQWYLLTICTLTDQHIQFRLFCCEYDNVCVDCYLCWEEFSKLYSWLHTWELLWETR